MKLNERFNLSGRTALVTGCLRGIGESVAINCSNKIGISGN